MSNHKDETEPLAGLTEDASGVEGPPSTLPGPEDFIKFLHQISKATGLSDGVVLAALNNPAVWDIINGNPGARFERKMSPQAMAELNSELNSMMSGLAMRIKKGDFSAALLAVGLQRSR